MRKALFAFAVQMAFAARLLGQALPLFPQHAEYLTHINPAAMPVEHLLQEVRYDWSASSSHRNQWAAQSGPKYLAGRVEWSNTKDPDGLQLAGLGAHLLAFKTGPVQRTGVFARVAARQNLNNRWRLCGGISLGSVFYQANVTQLFLLHSDDPALTNLPRSQTQAALGAGVFAYYRPQGADEANECVWTGASMPQALARPFHKTDSASLVPSRWSGGPLYVTAGWHTSSAHAVARTFIEPSIWLKSEPGFPLIPEASCKWGLQFEEPDLQFWLCAGYAFQTNMIHTELGFDWNIGLHQMARFTAAYDLFRQRYRSLFPAAFEVGLAFLHKK